MKRCPECRRDYYDDTLLYCLDDGNTLLEGPASVGEPATAILSEPPASTGGQFDSEAVTKAQIHTTAPEAKPRGSMGDSPKTHSFSANRAAKPLVGAIVAGLILVGGFFGYRYFSSTGDDQINSIAVLPFQNTGGDPDAEYLSDGLTESLIYRLSQIPELKVSPRSSVFRYKGQTADAEKVGNELGVDAVMSGRVIQRGDNLTISVDLVDVRNKKTLWGEQYERKMSDLLATQREIAAEIASKLQLRLSGEGELKLAKNYTENNDAYQLYLKGRFHFAKRNKADVERSIEYFKQAIALDPNFALAYARLADSYNGMTAYPYMAPKEAIPLAKTAANRAIEIDPSLAEAHTALANSLACFDWNWKEAEREFKRALELNPNDAGTHWRYGMFYLMPVGRHEEAIAEGKRSLELEPLDLNHGANLSGLYFYAGRYDEALEHARQVHSLDANFIVGRWALSQAYIQKGLHAEAIALNEEALQTDPTNPVFLRFAGIAYAKAGRRQDAERIIERFRDIAKTEYVMSYHIALIYSALGDKDKALSALEISVSEHDYLLPRIKVEPFLDPLRDDPRFKAINRKAEFSWKRFMKRCPECRRDYYDDTLVYCLDDGNALLEGPATGSGAGDEPATAILSVRAASAGGQILGEAPTRHHIGSTPAYSNSIAVLPFVNMSPDAENEYFCDGLSEELLNALAKIDDLKVAARTSAFSFKGTNTNVNEIGRALNVKTVLEGSVRKSGNRLRITAQLVNASDGYHLWSERYDREMKDIFDVQDEITVAVVDALKVKLFGEEKAAVLKRHTRNPEALEFYLRGLSYFTRFTPEYFQKAIESFDQAIAIDPNYASAYAGLAESYSEMSFFGSPGEWMPKAKEAALKALELDNTLGNAHNSLAVTKMYYDRDYAGAEHEFKRAIALDPGSAHVHMVVRLVLGVDAPI